MVQGNKFSYFDGKDNLTIRDFEKSMGFAVSFLFSFFFAGVTGYFLGDYMGYSQKGKYFMAACATILTIIVQTLLFVIKMNRSDRNAAKSAANAEKPTGTKLKRD